MLLLIAALQASVPAEDAFARQAWGRIGRSEALSRNALTIEIATDGYDKAAKRFEHKLRLTSKRFGGAPAILWANSRTCPAVRDVTAFADLPVPRPQPPGDDVVVIADGIGYSVTVPMGYDGRDRESITLRSNVGTPLASWIESTLAKLERCWSPVELRVPS